MANNTAISTFEINILSYLDSSATNNPQLRIFDYDRLLSENVTSPLTGVKICTHGTDTVLPSVNPSKWIFIETDQTIRLKFNGGTETVVEVAPSVAGVSDGVFFKRGSFTSVSVNVPGATDAIVRYFLGS